jgi:hypothetical protein
MLAETLPLEEVQARIAYLGLPLFGKRLPAGGMEEVMRRQVEDYVLQLLLPVVEQAMHRSYRMLSRHCKCVGSITRQELVYLAGGCAALLSLVESPLPITTIVLAGVTKDLVSAVDAFERGTKQYYSTLKEQFPWIEERHSKYQRV